MKGHYSVILDDVECRVDSMLRNMIRDKDSFHYGGFISPKDGIVHPGGGVGVLSSIVPLYLNKDSKYYKNEIIYEKILAILGYLERIQRTDGTFDLLITNFYSSPDTGFIVQRISEVYRVMEQCANGVKIEEAKNKLFEIIKRAGEGIKNGGFHTPNHRWVVASALMLAHNITKEISFRNMAERYLSEGIDCDEEGEYTERSTGIYNAVNNEALIILAEELDKPELLAHVKRNLDMMLTYIESDGTVFTHNSVRQDKGEGVDGYKFYPIRYYDLYLKMAYHFNDGIYANMANEIFLNSQKYRSNVPNKLCLFMLRPELKDFEIELLPIPTSYHKYYENSGIVRARKDEWSYTILKDNSSFLFFRNSNVQCYVKLCASFFARGQFKAHTLEKNKDGYKLQYSAHGFYRMPFEEAPESSNWHEMDHSLRELTSELTLNFQVHIKEIDKGLELSIVTDGCDRVPIKLEFGFTANTWVENDMFTFISKPGDDLILKDGYIKVKKDLDSISVGPGFGKHAYAAEMRGSDIKSPYDFTVYMTDFTNLEKTVYITSNDR
ncbi:MAG: hypothetical protein GX974_01960 [Clostridiales bacterium]|nr:hypothetical protein [Clostridiales bacterium]